MITVFCTQDDAVLKGDDDLVTIARVTARVKAFMPAEALVTSPVTPLRTRGKQQRNLGFFEVGLQAKDATLMKQYTEQLLKPEHHFLQVLPIGDFPTGPAVSIVVSEEDMLGALAQFMVDVAGVRALSYSRKVPRHMGFGHCILVVNTTLTALLAVGGPRVTNVQDVVQVGLSGAEDAVRATIYAGIMVETPQLQLAVLGDVERADWEEGGPAAVAC